jgi:hypothetical protein
MARWHLRNVRRDTAALKALSNIKGQVRRKKIYLDGIRDSLKSAKSARDSAKYFLREAKRTQLKRSR